MYNVVELRAHLQIVKKTHILHSIALLIKWLASFAHIVSHTDKNLKCFYLYLACTDGDIKLVGGSTMYEGTVEICYGGIWGMVGSLNWGSADARVVCYQLGFGLTGWLYYISSCCITEIPL